MAWIFKRLSSPASPASAGRGKGTQELDLSADLDTWTPGSRVPGALRQNEMLRGKTARGAPSGCCAAPGMTGFVVLVASRVRLRANQDSLEKSRAMTIWE